MCEVCEKIKGSEQYKYCMQELEAAGVDEDQFDILENMVFSIILSYEIILGANASMQEILFSALKDDLDEDDSDYLVFPLDKDRMN
jgi:hypothetical protein